MNALKKIWEWRILIFVVCLGSWIWYEDTKSKEKKAEEDKILAAQAETKRAREQSLFEAYQSQKIKSKCNISFEVTLETFGATVNVELRVGSVGDSFPLVVKQASDGKLNYTGLCPSRYFLAIGDDKSVSTTPVQEFVSGHNYTSKVHLTKGVGNMGSSRRELL